MLVRIGDYWFDLNSVRSFIILDEAGAEALEGNVGDVMIEFGDGDEVTLEDEVAEKARFYLNYVLPSTQTLADVNISWEHRDAVIASVEHVEAARAEEIAKLSEQVQNKMKQEGPQAEDFPVFMKMPGSDIKQ
jgi:hypothetical protein